MTWKTALIASAIWMGLVILISAVLIATLIRNAPGGIPTNERASQLGSAIGTLAGFGFAAIWLPFAFSLRRQRLAKLKKTSRKSRSAE